MIILLVALLTLRQTTLARQAQTDPQAAELFRWLDSLEFARQLEKPFVKVIDESPSRYPKGRAVAVGFGFLLRESGGSFEVMLPNLVHATYPPYERYGTPGVYKHVPADFAAFIDARHKNSKRKFWELDGASSSSGLFQGGESASLAWICHKKGLLSEERELVGEGKDWCAACQPKRAYVPTMKDELAAESLNVLVPFFEDTSLTREVLLSRFESFGRAFPGVPAVKRYEQAIDLLRSMVAEDRAHALKEPNKTGSLDAKIEELIFQLRNDSDSNYSQEQNSAQSKLEAIGLPAVPRLISALHDNRFTRQVFHPMSGPRSLYDEDSIERVSYLAEQTLESIAHRSFQAERWRDMAGVEKNARAWYAAIRTQGEAALLIEGARSGSSSQAERLVEAYPKLALDPIIEGYAKERQGYERAALIRALKPLPAKTIRPFLTKVIAQDKDVEPRVEAIQVLAVSEPDRAVVAMEREWRNLGTRADFNAGSSDIIGFMLESGRPAMIRSIQRDFRQKSADIRFEVISALENGYDGRWATHYPRAWGSTETGGDAFARAVEDLLALELTDQQRWGGGQMIGNELSFSAPHLSEMATYALSKCFPGVYPFSKQSSESGLDKQRWADVAVYRHRRGLTPLPPPKSRIPRALNESEMKPLIVSMQLGRPGAMAAILKKGLGGLPALEAARKNSPKDAAAKFDYVQRLLANTLRTVDFPSRLTAREKVVASRIRSWIGRSLTTDHILKLLHIVSKGISHGKTRPVSFSLERGGDFSGFTISIDYHSDSVQGRASVMLNGDSIRGMGGGDAESYGRPDEYLLSGIHRCLAAPVTDDIAIAVDIPGRR